MPRRSFAYTIRLADVFPVTDPAYADAPKSVRDEVKRWLVVYGLKSKDADLAAGLDKMGQALAPIKVVTAEHRDSEMGPADPSAPPLMPAYGVSRTRLLLKGEPTPSGAQFWWGHDPFTGGSWGEILAYHRKGGKGRLKRDVIGISPAAMLRVRMDMTSRWLRWKLAGLKPGWTPERPVPPPVPQLQLTGRTDYEHFTYGIGTTGAPRAGQQATGFFQRRPGTGWTAMGGPDGGGPGRPFEPEPPIGSGNPWWRGPKTPKPRPPKPPSRPPVPVARPIKPKLPLPRPVPPKPPELPRVRGESTRQEYLNLRERVAKLPEFSPERRAHVMEWVRERATETATSQRMHGMTDAEDLHSLIVDDVKYHFPALPSVADIARGKAMEAERVAINARIDALYREKAAIDARWTRENPLNEQRARVEADLAVADVELKRIMGLPPAPDIRHPFVSTLTNFAEEPELPRALRGITKEVVFSRQRSKDDPHYAVEYKKPDFKSSATGGDGNVVVYNGQMIDVRAFAHETAHNFATVKSKLRGDFAGTNPGPAYRLAMASGEPPVTDYAKNSPSEDFAEAVQYYVVSPRNMEVVAPRRYAVIKRLMEEPGYGG